jgi:nucleoside-diphosphate-sugar epimerase
MNKDPAPRRILVTGSAGFLGSFLSEKLLQAGHEVICVDNFYTGRRDNIAHLMDNKRFEVIRHDITFPLYVEVDEIYNLACPASPVHYQHDPVQTIKTSVHGAINMLGLAKRLNIKILQTSTSEVYGDPDVHPQVEDYWGYVNPSVQGHVMMRANAVRRAFFSATIVNICCASRLLGYSTRTAQECNSTTVVWSRTSSCRLLKTNLLPFTAMATKAVHFAM